MLLIEGKLYGELKPAQTAVQQSVAEPAAEKIERRGRKPGSGFKSVNQKIKEHKERKARRVLGPDAEEAIIAEIRGGMGLSDACKKYDISVSTFYRLKGESLNGPVKEIN